MSFGPVEILWIPAGNGSTIVRILLSKPGLSAEDQAGALYPDARIASCPQIEAIAAAIQAFLEGKNIAFSLSSVDLRSCSAFQQSVLRAEHGIPRGSVGTYQRIAAHLGVPNGARAVGNALANNPFPLIVPCHRAIRSDRLLGGFQGGLAMKRALLENDGVIFDGAGRVARARFHYDTERPNRAVRSAAGMSGSDSRRARRSRTREVSV